MTDQELNLAIMELLGLEPVVWETRHMNAFDGIVHVRTGQDDPVDYCGDWNELMPLVVEHGLTKMTMDWVTLLALSYVPLNPQRALAECLLLVLQNKEK